MRVHMNHVALNPPDYTLHEIRGVSITCQVLCWMNSYKVFFLEVYSLSLLQSKREATNIF